MDKAGEYFTFAELQTTSTGLPNTAPNDARLALCALAALVLDPLRQLVARPVRITSGYRSADVNRAVGGRPDSRHLFGLAADLKVEGFKAEELVRLMVSAGLPFERALFYHELRGGHVHVQITAAQVSACVRAHVQAPLGSGAPSSSVLRGMAWGELHDPRRIFWVDSTGDYIEQRISFETARVPVVGADGLRASSKT